jgi:YVTN family beta-propeller protein
MSITTRLAISDNKLCWHARSIRHYALCSTLLLLAACGGGDSGPETNSPLSTPMALVVNQDDTTLTTLRLDGKNSPIIGTLSLGPTQSDAIGGVTFSLGEWIFVTHTAGNRVATIDPIGTLAPILEDFLDASGSPRVGQRPKRVYRDSVDKEVLWTMNEGDPVTGVDTIANCVFGGSATVLHNSHISAGGARPHIRKTTCLFGNGEQFAAFSRPTAASPGLLQRAFISSKTAGLISVVTADPIDGGNQWNALIPLDLCDSAKEACDANPFSPNLSAPAGMFWSQATGKIYSYLSGYSIVVEIDPVSFAITRRVDIALPAPSTTVFHSVGVTPDGRFLFLVGEDLLSDPTKVIGKFGVVDLTAAVLSITPFLIPELDNLRPAFFQFTPDGRRLYVTQSNKISDLVFGAQAHDLKLDRLLVFDPSTLPAAPAFMAEVSLPAAETHGMDLWITGPQSAGSAKGIVITNATPGANGTVSLIDAASNTRTADIPVGRNPKQVTVYYVGLAASDNQATPHW